MSVSRREIQRAEAFGRLAARSGQAIDSCPYEANGGPDERVLAARFIHAYVGAGGVVPVDLGDGTGMSQGPPRYRRVERNGQVIRVAVLRRREP